LRGDAQKLREERVILEGMIKSRNELLMEMAKKYGLNCMGENNDDEEEDDDDKRNATAPPAPAPPVAVPEEIVEEEAPMEMVPE
jgi:hypothetical protein